MGIAAALAAATGACVPRVSADLIVVGGRVWTGVIGAPLAEAVAVSGERIVAIGPRARIEALAGPATRRIDAGGGFVTPGFVDAHVHFIDGGFQLASVQLRDAATPEEFVRRVAAHAARLPAGAWLLGGNWDHQLWGGTLPHRQWIDAVTPDRPVFLSRLDGHMALANSAALAAAGIDAATAEVPGGEIVRDARGRPTGILKDNAMALVWQAVPPPTPEQTAAAIERAQRHALAHGVTTVHHMGSWSDLEAFRAARRDGRLHVRVHACVPLSTWTRLREFVAEQGRGDIWLRHDCLKGFVDGSLGSHTAAFLEPYADAGDSRGLLVNDLSQLADWILGADAARLRVIVHAIGDRAIRRLLDIYEQVAARNGPRDRRFRIEHAQHIHPQDLPRFGALGVIASVQPYHAIDDGRWAERVIGRERARTTYAFRALLDTGATLAFGSDWTVAPLSPVEALYAAVTRRTLDGAHPDGWLPEQRIGVEEALRATTVGGALAGFEEHLKGTLEEGKLADIVILDADPFAIPPERLRRLQVRTTIVGGRVRYSR